MDYRRRDVSPETPTPLPSSAAGTLGNDLLASRPLSDIREITEPSLLDSTRRRTGIFQENTPAPVRSASVKRELQSGTVIHRPESRQGRQRSNSDARREPRNQIRAPAVAVPRRSESRQGRRRSLNRSPDSPSNRSSTYSVPQPNVPQRSDSKFRNRLSASLSRAQGDAPGRELAEDRRVENWSKTSSPIKETVSRLNHESPNTRRVPSKTIVKKANSSTGDILDNPIHQHPRLKVDVQVAAPLFVGGSSVEGVVRIVVDEAERLRHRKTLTLESLSVDLLGVEELSGSKRHVFLSLGNELVDVGHPPPPYMVESQQPFGAQGRSWILIPSVSTLPFLLTLPLEVGPPPFHSKNARIRYVICATLTIKDGGRTLCVRASQDTSVLSVYDPEKALVSLPSPLTASDEYILHRGGGHERVIVTAGLHRQVWVSGTNIFADVHVINNSRKTIKKLDLQLERIILCYRHAAASTLEMSASQARLFDQLERNTVCRTTVKRGTSGWNGVLPHTSDLRTCHLELPRGHATIKCNKYFEVRYYLNVVVGSRSTGHSSKLVTVQLPIILIHMNSLDVPTNSVDQVAAAIEMKRGAHAHHHRRDGEKAEEGGESVRAGDGRGWGAATSAAMESQGSPRVGRKNSRSLQGRAFSAPRRASLERQRARQEELRQLGQVLDNSPRKQNRQDLMNRGRNRSAAASAMENRGGGGDAAAAADENSSRQRQPAGVNNNTVVPSAQMWSEPFSFRTPPSNRKGRVFMGDDADALRQRLGHMRSFMNTPGSKDAPSGVVGYGAYASQQAAGTSGNHEKAGVPMMRSSSVIGTYGAGSSAGGGGGGGGGGVGGMMGQGQAHGLPRSDENVAVRDLLASGLGSPRGRNRTKNTHDDMGAEASRDQHHDDDLLVSGGASGASLAGPATAEYPRPLGRRASGAGNNNNSSRAAISLARAASAFPVRKMTSNRSLGIGRPKWWDGIRGGGDGGGGGR
ncbi:MAG: hypothetical protein M1831_000241 [Alyxoria varia]|nr:MAG: hypothetical protein M1831_000241 [Alyxoria varia]